jgi:hypothetical protein
MTATAAPGTRFIFSGHAIGASAHFHRLDATTGLNHLVPTQAASVLPQTGGLSEGSAKDYRFEVDQPRPRTLFSIGQAASKATGVTLPGAYQTEVSVDLQTVGVVEKLNIGLVHVHMLSSFPIDGTDPVLTTNGNRLEEVWLGSVHAVIELDDEPLRACGTQAQLAAYYRSQDAGYRQQYAWRFATPAGAPEIQVHGQPDRQYSKCSVVRSIQLVGPEDARQSISVDGYTIVWEGFGKIILGEIHVKGTERHLTMARLAMGSDAGGSGSGGDVKSNGAVGTG